MRLKHPLHGLLHPQEGLKHPLHGLQYPRAFVSGSNRDCSGICRQDFVSQFSGSLGRGGVCVILNACYGEGFLHEFLQFVWQPHAQKSGEYDIGGLQFLKEYLADYLELSLPSKAHHVVQCKVYVLQRVGTCSNLLWCALNRLYLFHYRLFVCCWENCHEKRVSDDVVIARAALVGPRRQSLF